MPQTRLDHLVVAAASLAEGCAWVEARLGVASPGGGRHANMGTHNALWSLGGSYIEVIAVEPGGTRPERPRWFGLDDPRVDRRCSVMIEICARHLQSLQSGCCASRYRACPARQGCRLARRAGQRPGSLELFVFRAGRSHSPFLMM